MDEIPSDTGIIDSLLKKPFKSTLIGSGSFGTVMRITDLTTNQDYAMKIIDLNQPNEAQRINHYNRIKYEINILKKLTLGNFKYFPKYLDYKVMRSADKGTNGIKILMEYIAGDELFDFVNSKQFLELNTNDRKTLIKNISLDILKAIQVLHHNSIVHRDLKLENIKIDFINPSAKITTIKLVDFGLSCDIDNTKKIYDSYATQIVGTPEYMSPQIIENRMNRSRNWKIEYLMASDMWSFGVILYFMIYNNYPFGSRNIKGDSRLLNSNIRNYSKIKYPFISDFQPLFDQIFIDYHQRVSVDNAIHILQSL